MKILHKSKRALPPLPQVAELIVKLHNTPNDDLHEVLGGIDSWKWPRSDLNAWIKVLNKFDAILEEVIRDYDVDKLQLNVFTPLTKKTICEILRFERLLLENSTNRKTFASYDRINSLLSTSDLDVLVLALNLLLRPAQQYSAQPAVSRALSISTPRLQSLAKRWSHLREYGVSIIDLVTEAGKASIEALPTEAREVQFNFYKTDKNDRAKEKPKDMEIDAPDPLQTPSRRASTAAPVATPATVASGATAIHIDGQTLQSKNTMDVLADSIETFGVPEDERFELMCRIRTAQVLLPGREEDREKLAVVRLLATAIFVHTHPESQAASALFLYEPDLIPHIAELLALDRGVPVAIQTAAVAALDAMARYRTKVQDVLAAVNAGVNHGTLMALLRKTVADVANPESSLPHSFVEALLSFVTFLASHAAGGNMVVGAGLVPLLIQIIENRLPQRLAVVSKTMQLVDNVLYSFANAFQLFCNNRGVEVLVERIAYEVDYSIETLASEERQREVPKSYGQLPVVRAAALKHILRSMHRMMQSSGTAEGLRGLIDSSLLKSIKKIIEHRNLFGPNIMPLAINILATFVHNEPTSLAIIQEAGVPEVFYRAIEAGLEPVIEVIQSIPNAIGALCLNQAGQDQLTARPTIIPGLFSIFTSERHQRVLQDKENAVLIGTSIDELIRHHPSLKPAVFEAIKSTLSKIEDLGATYVPPDNIKAYYQLSSPVAPQQISSDGDVNMEPVEAPVGTDPAIEAMVNDILGDDDTGGKSHENLVVSYMDVICRFLEGLFQHTSHCKDFITSYEGLERIGRLTALPCMPYDFGGSVASDSLVQVVRTMYDAAPNVTITALAGLVKASLQGTSEFWGSLGKESKLITLLDLSAQSEVLANQTFRKLITLHVRVLLLSDIYATAGYSHGRSSGGLLQSLMGRGAPDIIPDLGALHRACIWENVLLKTGLPVQGSDSLATQVATPSSQSPTNAAVALPEQPATATNGAQPESTSSTPTATVEQEAPNPENVRENNAKALRHVANQIPAALSPFFQSIVKLFTTRRNPEAVQKQQILDSATVLAGVLTKHLDPIDFEDTLAVLSYYTSLLGLITTLLVDERTAQSTLHTVLLEAFYRQGGMDAINAVGHRFESVTYDINLVDPTTRSDLQNVTLGHAYGALKVTLHLLQSLVSPKPIFESSQTALLLTRDKKDGDADYFEPHNFLVKLRLAAFPLARDLWQAFWMIGSPHTLNRSIVQVLLEIINGEGEESSTDVPSIASGGASLAVGGPSFMRSTVPDENRIRQLTDMGFPRVAAERALTRTHNNISAATELLLANPFRFQVAEPEPAAPPEEAPAGNENAMDEDTQTPVAAGEPAAAADTSAPEPTEPTPAVVETDEEPKPPGKTAEEWRKELNAARDTVKATMGDRALKLIDNSPGQLFDFRNIFIGPVGGYQQSSIRILLNDIKVWSPYAHDIQEEAIATRCRLLALILNESPASFTSYIAGDEKSVVDTLLALLLANPIAVAAENSTIPKWLASLLLVTEALLTLGEDPRSITLPKEDEPVVKQDLLTGPLYPEARSVLFDFSLRLLGLPSLPRDDLLASLRLLVLLTRDHNTALEFVRRDGISLLFKGLKSSSGGVAGSQSYITIILRHIAEDPAIVRSIMRQEIQRVFSHPRARSIDVTNFIRGCSAMALRDPSAFIEVTESIAKLERPGSHSLLLKDKTATPENTEPTAAPKDEQATAPMQVDTINASTTLAAPPDYLENVVHFLLGELTNSVKPRQSPTSDGATTELGGLGDSPRKDAPAPTISSDNQGGPAAGESDTSGVDYYYSGFLMQSLTELLFSYDACKVAFLSYSPKKRSSATSKDSVTKHRTATLQFFLSEIITFGTIEAEPSAEARKRIMLCNWAMSVVVALCVDTASSQDMKDVSPELVSVRKFVLEAVNRAIKDTSPHESADSRYGRLLALADLCFRLLTVRFNPGPRKPQEETPTHIAKVMLEKNFVATLTNALAEVDLDFPNVRGLVAAILKPLELLSKVAIKMSRASDKNKGLEDVKDDEADLSMSEDEDEDDEQGSQREETPDLYRNSSLGMFGGEMEDQYPQEDEMDEDQADEDEDVEMDFGEETGSEDTSDSDDEDHDDLENETGESEEGWQDEEEEDDEDLVEDEGGRPQEVDDEGDEDGDEEAVWEDVDVGEGIPPIDEDEGEEDDIAGEIPIYHHDGEDEEADMASDEELGAELGFEPHEGGPTIADMFGFNVVTANQLPSFMDPEASGVLMAGGAIRRRPVVVGDEDMEIFGRSRQPSVPPPDSITHPLLHEGFIPSGRTLSGQGRGARRAQRHVFATTGHQDLLQTIEDIIGGGAVQLFQHIINRRGPGGGTETIRLDVPAGTLVNLDRGLLPRRGGVGASLRIERASRPTEGREFDPLLTLQRWGEEVKILHGKFYSDRFAKLGNHVVLALLPAAIEEAKVAKEAKIAADKASAERREAEAKAEEAAEKAALEREATEKTPPPEETPATAAAERTEDEAATATVVVPDVDSEMADVVAEPEAQPDLIPAEASQTGHPSESPSGPSTTGTSGEAGTSSAPERVTVMIHGSPVDITDTGIDPTFLEALPDDMREEVVNQHIRDQRAARVERPADSQISTEFLDALPPEIRAEILQQERLEQARRRAEEERTAEGLQAGTGAVPAPVDIDPASFIASLDPQLRQDVLMEQDEGFIQTLPSHMIAEAGVYRERAPGRHQARYVPGGRTPIAVPNTSNPRKAAAPRDAIQLLDKVGIAVLVRLLFFPQISKKNVLFKVLVNLCENSKTRTELFNLLLNILQEGAGDLAAIDRSFAQMTFRNSKLPQTPRAAGKQKAGSDILSSLPVPHLPTEIVPDLIAQRCLEALSFIVTSNESSSLFFLTEHDLPLRRTASKKGKGKEKQVSHPQYPIVLLLGLLDRESLLKTPSIMELVVSLLDTVTRPLTGLKDSVPKKDADLAISTVPLIAPPVPPGGSNPSNAVADASAAPTQPEVSNAATASSPQPQDTAKDGAAIAEMVEEKALLSAPPQIPHPVLRFIVNILTVGECGAKPFHHTLSLIQHLSHIPEAREVIAQELRTKAQEFGQSLYQDLDELANALQGSGGDVLASSVASKFSSPSSDQAKLLRVLKTIDYMYSPKIKTPSSDASSSGDSDKIQSIYESFRFTPLWRRLGDCLSVIERRPEIEHIATVLLPLIESLMVVCKYVGSASATATSRAIRASASPRSPVAPRESMEDLFATFTEAHRKVLNVMVRNNPSLMSGSFSLLVHNPRVLDFDNKRNYFNQQLHRRPHVREHYGALQLNVRRQRVFEDSFHSLQRKSGEQIKYGKLSVRFYDEEGVDAGGVTREWFQILARQMFDPNNALFEPCAADRLTYQPNKASWVNPEHLSFFKFVGRVIGKAIYDGRLLDAYFARSLYRQILNKPVDYKDVEWIDPEYYNSLCWILENDPSPLDLNFSVEGDEFGVTKTVPLKENGASIPVTLENRREFVQLSAQYRLYSSIKDQLEHLLAGFYEIIPKDLVSIFNEQELELLISGTPDIDVDEWRAATEYNGYTSSDPVIVWWWRALKSFNRDERAKLLSFATGTSRVPLSGFSDLQGVQGTQRFSIHRAYGDSDRLPQAHTCFNQIDLPQYSSYEMLRQQLLLAINEGGEGFGFA
ncbi:hypothetical protein BV25DRAFT_1854068 [Artomyces pyxidatus]|uniref:Uncharacterized protein n=1 Tax=Artomyces pyxidatus TaxID=48021 RepID=A0ACB8T513_9AGAM|nr:hypothetical protein BV25DRAFT_1854068 [Artomyces pyxidatus]